jgi:hypothetical protein
LLACPGSFYLDSVTNRETPSGEAANLGSATHEALAKQITPGGCSDDALEAIARKWNVKIDQLRPLFFIGRRIWQDQLLPSYRVAEVPYNVECEYDATIGRDLSLTGHADVVIDYADDHLVIIDWKTGTETGADYTAQLKAYAYLAARHERLARQREITRIDVVTVWVREQAVDVESYEWNEIENFGKEIDARLSESVYAPGCVGCKYCPHFHQCAALSASERDTANHLAIIVGEPQDLTLTPEKLLSLKPQADALAKTLEAYKDLLREKISAAGEVIYEGKRWLMSPVDTVKIPLSDAVAEILGADFVAELRAQQTISKTKLNELLGKESKAVLAALDDAGALIKEPGSPRLKSEKA